MVANNNSNHPLVVKAGAIVLGVVTDVVVVLLAWLAGYAAALLYSSVKWAR